MAKVAFLGMGVMGYPMAGHLVKAGHEVTVYNRTTAKARAWADEHGGTFAETPREAAEGCEFVMACVGNDDDLRGVCLGDDGAFAGIANDAIIAPSYGISTDDEVREKLTDYFPGRTVELVPVSDIAVGGGGIHCITQQQPSSA